MRHSEGGAPRGCGTAKEERLVPRTSVSEGGGCGERMSRWGQTTNATPNPKRFVDRLAGWTRRALSGGNPVQAQCRREAVSERAPCLEGKGSLGLGWVPCRSVGAVASERPTWSLLGPHSWGGPWHAAATQQAAAAVARHVRAAGRRGDYRVRWQGKGPRVTQTCMVLQRTATGQEPCRQGNGGRNGW